MPRRAVSAASFLAVCAVQAGAAWASAAWACEPPALPGAQRVESARHVVDFRLTPAPLPLNAPFAVEFTICAKDGAALGASKLDAWMPAHRHGMNYRPSVTTLGPGRIRAEGLLFHMPGRWEFLFDIGGDRIAAPQDLK